MLLEYCMDEQYISGQSCRDRLPVSKFDMARRSVYDCLDN